MGIRREKLSEAIDVLLKLDREIQRVRWPDNQPLIEERNKLKKIILDTFTDD